MFIIVLSACDFGLFILFYLFLPSYYVYSFLVENAHLK